MRFSKTRELQNQKWRERLLLNIVEHHPAPAPIWCLPHIGPDRLARRDSHKEGHPWQGHCPLCLLLPHCSSLLQMWDVQPQLRLEPCRGLPSWFWLLFPVCTSVISQQTKVPADSTQESVPLFLGPPNPTKPMADSTGLGWKSFTLPVNGEHGYNSACNLWKFNTQKLPCQDKVEEKQNHCCYNPVFISANLPSKPPVLQAVFYYTVHKGEEKKCKQKKMSDLLGRQFIPHFSYSATYDCSVCMSLSLNSAHPLPQRAEGQ